MPNVKRRQTTGGTPESNKKKVLKTYGTKASKDDFDFHGSSDEGGGIVLRKRTKQEASVNQAARTGAYEKESHFLGSSASNDPLDERQDTAVKSVMTMGVDDTIITAAPKRCRKRANSLDESAKAYLIASTKHTIDQALREVGTRSSVCGGETGLSDSATKRRRSRRRMTTHYDSSAAQQATSTVLSEALGGATPNFAVVETAAPYTGPVRPSPDVLPLVQNELQMKSNSTSTSIEIQMQMLPPLMRQAWALQQNSECPCLSTIPNATPAEPSQQPQDAMATDSSHINAHSGSSSARMTSPTIASNSTQGAEHAYDHRLSGRSGERSKTTEGAVSPRLAEEKSTISGAPQPSPFGKERRAPIVLPPIETQEFDHEGKDELALPLATDKGSHVNIQLPKGIYKRKVKDDIHMDELGSDDIAVGLAKEQYQPRPSRSRAHRADDEFLLEVDFSKRPEAVAKAKNKRRRTTGGHVPVHEDAKTEDLPELALDESEASLKARNKRLKATACQSLQTEDATVADLPQNGIDDLVKDDEKKKTLEPTQKADQAAIVNAVDADMPQGDVHEDNKPAAKTEEPKKKRGRPRKKTAEDFAEPSNDEAPAAPIAKPMEIEKPIKPPPAMKAAERRKTDEPHAQISEERVISDDEDPLQTQTETPSNGKLDALVFDANKSKLGPLDSPPRHPQAAPPVQTPPNQAQKGPDKHSPLNSGKVPYRVGLSKKARIEPLLKVMRK